MAYTIVKSDGTVLTTIADGTINTTSTTLGLPGRNYPGYGQTLDTNFVHILESFADDVPPANPLRGQLWFNTNTSTLYVCPINGAPNAAAWLALTATASGANTTFGNVDVLGTLTAAQIQVSNNVSVANLLSTFDLTVSNLATIANSTTTTATVGTLTTQAITTGGQSINGTLTGVWTANGAGTANGNPGTSMWITGGNLVISGAGAPGPGIKSDNYMFANGVNLFSTGGAYSNSNVAAYLPTYVGNFGAVGSNTAYNGNVLSAGTNTSLGNVTGNWSFTTGSKLYLTDSGTSANIANLNVTTIVANGNITSTANIYANTGTIGASLLTGILTVASSNQPNLTQVGTLISLGVTGNVTSNNVIANSYHIRSVGAGLSAAGATQGTATALTKEFNIVGTVPTSATGVKLPTAVAGMAIVIVNTTATNMLVYPDTGATINSLGTNISFTHVAGAALQYIASSTTQWYTVGASYA